VKKGFSALSTAAAILELLQSRLENTPVKARDIWPVLSPPRSYSTVQQGLTRLERAGLVVRERRFTDDGAEMASLWRLAEGDEWPSL
jgi:predicted transcriptional regulator